MVLNQINDFQVQVAIPITLEIMPKQMYDLTIEAIAEMCDTAENHSKYGDFQYWSASLMIIVETDGSKTIFLDIDVYYENDSLHKSYRLENLSEDLINKYCGIAFLTAAKNLADSISKCEFTLEV